MENCDQRPEEAWYTEGGECIVNSKNLANNLGVIASKIV